MFKEMLALKIEEQRAAMRLLEKSVVDLTNHLTYAAHSEAVVSLEVAQGNLDWLEKYGVYPEQD